MPKHPQPSVFPVGSTVRITISVAGMAAGSQGMFLKAVGHDHAIVCFWDGGPLKVPLAAVEAVFPI